MPVRLQSGNLARVQVPGIFEGFCSGNGISQLGTAYLNKMRNQVKIAAFWPEYLSPEEVTAKDICIAAAEGDADALAIVEESADYLGRGISVLIDLLNPECIVIGSIFARAGDLFRPVMERVLKEEALVQSLRVCRVVPAKLGEAIGDVAALTIAIAFSQEDNIAERENT